MPKEDDSLAAFLGVVNAHAKTTGHASLVPDEDVADLESGASYIPDQVTDARRRGETVTFVQNCPVEQWRWEMPDGSTISYSP